MYGFPGNGIPGDGYRQGDGNEYANGDRLVGRIEAAEYNLAVQRGDAPQATNIIARMFGQWLANRFGR